MTRGNQRELARAKNLKKQQATGKSKSGDDKDGNKGANLLKRQERDAEVMRLKQQKAAEKKASAEGGAGTSKK
ncbi:small EDRK-rich factor 2-like [Paramuricea clavata]|uniref:Small EDRK-rich factor 2-like n=1 Tax=Paramuricea clavata TaxID=317549 RepID=A0A7D9DIL2_PARCT|nr:small EDRK-rich factor 2-like [Paramuricea clavata]